LVCSWVFEGALYLAQSLQPAGAHTRQSCPPLLSVVRCLCPSLHATPHARQGRNNTIGLFPFKRYKECFDLFAVRFARLHHVSNVQGIFMFGESREASCSFIWRAVWVLFVAVHSQDVGNFHGDSDGGRIVSFQSPVALACSALAHFVRPGRGKAACCCVGRFFVAIVGTFLNCPTHCPFPFCSFVIIFWLWVVVGVCVDRRPGGASHGNGCDRRLAVGAKKGSEAVLSPVRASEPSLPSNGTGSK
jgi:hypothetical protein